MRFAAVSCPLAPQASHASSSVSRQFRALRSISSPLGGSHPYPAVQRQVPMSVYFGGSRNLSHFPVSVVRTVLASGQAVHVGCQKGADSLVVTQCLMQGYALSLVVFAVAPNSATAPDHVIGAAARGARVVYSAGGQATPIKARYLLRSIAAFQGYVAPFKKWLTKKEQKKVQLLGAVLKIADGLHATKRNIIQHIDMKSDENTVTIKLLCTKTFRPEQYQAEKQKKHLEKVVKKNIVLEFTKL